MSIGLYKVVYQKDEDRYEVVMPLSDMLTLKAVVKKDSAAILIISAAFVIVVAREYSGKIINPEGLKNVTIERLRSATLLEQFKSFFLHRKLSA